MTTPPESDRKAFIMIWTVENFSCSLTNVEYFSPEFTNNVDRKTFQLCVKRDRNNLVDFRLCHNVQGVDLDAELSLLNSDGSVLASKRFEHQIAFSLHDVCILKWRNLSVSSLIMRCRIWNNRNELPLSKTVSARTRLGKECISFMWAIKDYTSLQRGLPPSRRTEMEVQEQPIVLRFEANFKVEGAMTVALQYVTKGDISINSTFKISVLDSFSHAVDSNTDSSTIVIGVGKRFYKEFTQTLQFPLLWQKLIGKKDNLQHDALFLRCEVIMKGMAFHVMKDDQSSVRNWMISTFIPTETDVQYNATANHQYIRNSKNKERSSLVIAFKQMLENKLFSDYTLWAEDKAFHVHRFVLCSRSIYFRSMLSGDGQEASANSMEIPNVDADSLRRLILFIYTDNVEDGLNWKEVCRLYSIAVQYEVSLLRELCSSILNSRVCIANACEIIVLADLHSDDTLRAAVRNYFVVHGNQIVRSVKWDKFRGEHSSLADELLIVMPVKKKHKPKKAN